MADDNVRMNDVPDCFVVMGFGTKTDPVSGKTFDLDKTYEYIIKSTVEKKLGMSCARADELRYAGTIDVPMYQMLLEARLVIADLSTLNPNAFYELGVRYALKPSATVVIAESGFRNPFDTNHILTLKYTHLGTGIDYGEVKRFSKELYEQCVAVLNDSRCDSPVFTFFPALTIAEERMDKARIAQLTARQPAIGAGVADPTLAELMKTAIAAKDAGDMATARSVLQGVVSEMGDHPEPFAVQQLALTMYKSRQPNEQQALKDAKQVLRRLNPEADNDPESLGLWGAIHKRLYDITGELQHLDTSVFAYEKGYYLKDDYYNGINLAFMLDVRAAASDGDERIADRVQARRVRCRLLDVLPKRIDRLRQRLNAASNVDKALREEHFWMLATMAEAHLGSGDAAAAQEWADKATTASEAPWMRETMEKQMATLQTLLAACGQTPEPAAPGGKKTTRKPARTSARKTSAAAKRPRKTVARRKAVKKT